jgi:hypothetical protein
MFREPVPDGHSRNGRHLLSVRGRLSRRPHPRALLRRCTGNFASTFHFLLKLRLNRKWIIFRAIDWPVSANASGQSAAESGVPWLPATPKSSSPGKYYSIRQAPSPVALDSRVLRRLWWTCQVLNGCHERNPSQEFYAYYQICFPFNRHADGTVKFWDSSSLSLQVLYRLKTSKVFDKTRVKNSRVDGVEPSLMDDNSKHLSVQRLAMCPEGRLLAVAGASGHVILFKFRRQESSQVRKIQFNL